LAAGGEEPPGGSGAAEAKGKNGEKQTRFKWIAGQTDYMLQEFHESLADNVKKLVRRVGVACGFGS
jgi:hypothetical protein